MFGVIARARVSAPLLLDPRRIWLRVIVISTPLYREIFAGARASAASWTQLPPRPTRLGLKQMW